MTIQEIANAIYELPMIKKYKDKYKPANLWACVEPYEIEIFLWNARKNYFIKTIQQIQKIAGVSDAWYEKAQDETVSDCIKIVLKRGIKC